MNSLTLFGLGLVALLSTIAALTDVSVHLLATHLPRFKLDCVRDRRVLVMRGRR